MRALGKFKSFRTGRHALKQMASAPCQKNMFLHQILDKKILFNKEYATFGQTWTEEIFKHFAVWNLRNWKNSSLK